MWRPPRRPRPPDDQDSAAKLRVHHAHRDRRSDKSNAQGLCIRVLSANITATGLHRRLSEFCGSALDPPTQLPRSVQYSSHVEHRALTIVPFPCMRVRARISMEVAFEAEARVPAPRTPATHAGRARRQGSLVLRQDSNRLPTNMRPSTEDARLVSAGKKYPTSVRSQPCTQHPINWRGN
jgi:hypothetical protein